MLTFVLTLTALTPPSQPRSAALTSLRLRRFVRNHPVTLEIKTGDALEECLIEAPTPADADDCVDPYGAAGSGATEEVRDRPDLMTAAPLVAAIVVVCGLVALFADGGADAGVATLR